MFEGALYSTVLVGGFTIDYITSNPGFKVGDALTRDEYQRVEETTLIYEVQAVFPCWMT